MEKEKKVPKEKKNRMEKLSHKINMILKEKDNISAEEAEIKRLKKELERVTKKKDKKVTAKIEKLLNIINAVSFDEKFKNIAITIEDDKIITALATRQIQKNEEDIAFLEEVISKYSKGKIEEIYNLLGIEYEKQKDKTEENIEDLREGEKTEENIEDLREGEKTE